MRGCLHRAHILAEACCQSQGAGVYVRDFSALLAMGGCKNLGS